MPNGKPNQPEPPDPSRSRGHQSLQVTDTRSEGQKDRLSVGWDKEKVAKTKS